MSAPDLILPGFYGKLPSTGDFVTRRLPIGFVQPFDRWMSEHLAPLVDTEFWDEDVPLRFLSGASAFGAAAGVIFASRDRHGRRFPLSIVALPGHASMAQARADGWFRLLEAAGRAARWAEMTPDALDEALLALPMPEQPNADEIVRGLLVWTERSDWYELDPAAPRETLTMLLRSPADDRPMRKTAV